MQDNHSAELSAPRKILKIGLAVTDGSKILVVRKRGGKSFILPGGKPEDGEGDLETLQREVQEELGCEVSRSSLRFLGSFTDVAADMAGTTVTVRLYCGDLLGRPSPRSEIESLRWLSSAEDDSLLAPSLRNQILPFLFSQPLAR